jgi:hypothetical protein
MAIEEYRAEVRATLERLLAETPTTLMDRQILIDRYTNDLVQLHQRAAHKLLDEVMIDARTRLDARLSPDPVQQTIATVQTTMQDLWNVFWGPPPSQPPNNDRDERK